MNELKQYDLTMCRGGITHLNELCNTILSLQKRKDLKHRTTEWSAVAWSNGCGTQIYLTEEEATLLKLKLGDRIRLEYVYTYNNICC